MSNHRQVHLLQDDNRPLEVKHWTPWFNRLPAIRRKFRRWADDYDPFHWNETASVGVLANAAMQAGCLAHTEYVIPKRRLTRGRPFRNGRCDLWIAEVESGISWAFEAKQHWAAARIKQKTFDDQLECALRDAKQLWDGDADWRVGCLIVVPKQDVEQSLWEKHDTAGRLDELSKTADVAFRIGKDLGAIWLAFKFV